MKIDLQKVLSVAGQPGLFHYLSQSKGGVIVESMIDKKRSWMGPSARMTSLADISIYTSSDDEIRLQKVLESMHEYLKDQAAPDPKGNPQALKDLFAAVIPDYDKDRFYVSHMKKVVDWYNVLRANDSLEFEEPADEEAPDQETPDKEN